MEMETICPKFEKALELLSKRWTALIIYQLLKGPQRFNEIQQAIGISGKVLSERLKQLEQQQIVQRNIIPETPVIIKYALTEKGKAMEPILLSIEHWSQQWVESETN